MVRRVNPLVSETKIFWGACPHDCPDTCAWTVTVDEGRATAIEADHWASTSPSGRSANALTADGLSDLGQGGDFHDTLVEVDVVANPGDSGANPA